MRTLIVLSILLGSISLADKLDKPILFVEVKGRYATQRTIITKDKNEWLCSTELTPRHFSPVQPFSNSQLEKIRSASIGKSARSKSCRDLVSITDFSNGNEKIFSDCADSKMYSSFLADINKNCGRN